MVGGFGFSSDMSRDNPLLFESASVINEYAARAQYLLQRSRTRAKVGIFYQLFDYPNGNYVLEELVQGVLDETDVQLPKPDPIMNFIMSSSPDVEGERLWVKESARLGSDLVANGWYYQFFNEDSLLNASVQDGKVVMGEAQFEALLLFKESAMPAGAAEALSRLAALGIPVIFVGSRPVRDPGFFDQENCDRRVQAAIAAIGTPVFQTATEVIQVLQDAGVDPQIAYTTPKETLGFINKIDREDGSEFFFLRSRIRQEQTVSLHLDTGKRVPVELDLWSGAVTRLPFEKVEDGKIALHLTFPGYTSRVVALEDADQAVNLLLAPVDLKEIDLKTVRSFDDFSFTAQQRLADGTVKKIELVNIPNLDWRSIPELTGLGSPGTYQTLFHLENLQPGERYFLCFERVCDRADITLNGTSLPPLLVMPWRCEVSEWIKAGDNELSIKVTPTLRNALVSYGNKGISQYKQYKKSPTMPAGLIGVVRLCKL